MKNNSKCVYLMSSNASKEYVLDILETLSLPRGFVLHFRYQLRWLDDEIRNKLPKKGGNTENGLKNNKVVICYLYQKKKGDQWLWIDIFPIRAGILSDAYKTGDEDEDVAHFYFKVKNYISYDRQNFTEVLKEKIGEEKFGNVYAVLGSSFAVKDLAKKEESESAFHKICESLSLDTQIPPASHVA